MLGRPLPAIHIWSPRAGEGGAQAGVRERARRLQRDLVELAFPLLLLAGSTALWRRQNGPVTLFTDQVGARALGQLGLLHLWDEVDDEVLEGAAPGGGCRRRRGAIARFRAYRAMEAPFAALDPDLIVWQPLEAFLDRLDISFTHWQEIAASAAPAPPFAGVPSFEDEPGGAGNRPLRGANVAFLFLRRDDFKRCYVEEGLRDLGACRPSPSGRRPGGEICAEQRLLPVLGERSNLSMRPLLQGTWQGGKLVMEEPGTSWCHFDPHEPLVTHLRHLKELLTAQRRARRAYCRTLAERLMAEVSGIREILNEIRPLRRYARRPWF